MGFIPIGEATVEFPAPGATNIVGWEQLGFWMVGIVGFMNIG